MDPAALENILEKKCENYAWLAWILFLTASPIMFNSAHLTAYAFLGGEPSFFCNIPELVETNWTNEQIREISSPGSEKQSCLYYNWDYYFLSNLSFDEALSYLKGKEKPELITCDNHVFNEEVVHQTVISEWDLVCDNSAVNSFAENSVAIGKICGAAIFGIVSDRFGRKPIFVWTSLLYAVSGTAAGLVNNYMLFILFRMLNGVASSGVFDAGFTILLELTVKNYRMCLGNLFNLGSSFGLIYLSLAAYFTNTWRQLQLVISVPIFLLIIYWWLLPESPRWLITNGKFDKAAKILGKDHEMNFKETKSSPPNQPQSDDVKEVSFWKRYIEFFSTIQLTKRLIICCYIWFIGCLYYFTIALNGSNLDVNDYLYVALSGIIEMPGMISSILFLKYFGRKSTGICLWTMAGVTQLLTIVIPKGWPIMCVSLFGRLLGSGALGIISLHTSEMFPTEHRNFAISTCATIGQFGILLAPYLVHILGKKAWWMPSTACGFFSILAALFMIFLPETRDTPMPDLIHEMDLS